MHGKLIQLPFTGESMRPLLKTGDEILYQEKKETIEIGDILLFKDPINSELIIHRVLSLNPLLTKGDWSCQFESIPEQNVFGVVKGVIKKGESFLFSQKKSLIIALLFFSKTLLSQYRVKRWGARLGLLVLGPFMSYHLYEKNDF